MKRKKWSSIALSIAFVLGMVQTGAAAGNTLPKEPSSDTRDALCHMVVYPKDHEMGKYTAQMVTADGKHLFFDDIGCMFNYKRNLTEEPQKMWVRDYHTLEWIDMDKAHVISADIKTPMQYGFAYFKSKESADQFVQLNEKLEAIMVDWKFVDQLAQKRLEMKQAGHNHMGMNMDHHQMNKAKDIQIIINGEKLTFQQAPMMEKGRVLVPLRGVFEKLGATVNWDQQAKTVKAVKSGATINLKINSKVMTINKKQVHLDVAAELHNDHAMIPVRAISEAWGAKVEWDSNTRTVMIHSK